MLKDKKMKVGLDLKWKKKKKKRSNALRTRPHPAKPPTLQLDKRKGLRNSPFLKTTNKGKLLQM